MLSAALLPQVRAEALYLIMSQLRTKYSSSNHVRRTKSSVKKVCSANKHFAQFVVLLLLPLLLFFCCLFVCFLFFVGAVVVCFCCCLFVFFVCFSVRPDLTVMVDWA